MSNENISDHTRKEQPKRSTLRYVLISCFSLMVIWVVIVCVFIYLIYSANTNLILFPGLLSEKGDIELVNNLFKFDSQARPFTAPKEDFSKKNHYYLFGSMNHSLSLYYPSTHFIEDDNFSVNVNTFDDAIDTNYSEISLKIINLEKLNDVKTFENTTVGEVKSFDTESYVINGFAGFEYGESSFRQKANIEGKNYDIKTYKSKYTYDSDSELVKGCKNSGNYNYDTLFLNYKFFATIGYYTGKTCDPITGSATIDQKPDAHEFELTYSILNSIKYQNNQKEIKTFNESNTFDHYSDKLSTLSKEIGVGIHYDSYSESFRKDLARYKWNKTDFKGTFEVSETRNIVTLLYNELSKYPKSYFKKVGIKSFVFVKNLEEPFLNRELAGLSVPEKNVIFFDMTNISTKEFFPGTLHHELMHLFDFNIDYDEVVDDFSYWYELNETGDYVGVDKIKDNETLYATNNYSVRGFATGYGKTEIFEDRAEMYRFLINAPDLKYANYKSKIDKQFTKKLERIKSQIQKNIPEMNDSFFDTIQYLN